MSTEPSLLDALLAFQREAPTLPKHADNPHFHSKFVPLDTIVERVGPLLVKHGLTWSTFPCRDDHGPALRYVLAHPSTGDVLEGTMPLLLTKSDPQGQGSAITYARRYSICAVLNLVADEDDDGNSASAPAASAPVQDRAKDAQRPAAPTIPADRARSILTAAQEAGLAEGTTIGAVLKAKLATLTPPVRKLGALNVDQAETVESFIAAEAVAAADVEGRS